MPSHQPKPYGEEQQMFLPGAASAGLGDRPDDQHQRAEPRSIRCCKAIWSISRCRQVHGLTVIPVDRVVEVYASLKIDKIRIEQQAYAVCQILGCDGLIVPTVTAYDPYDPPKFGASLQLFMKPGTFKRLPEG